VEATSVSFDHISIVSRPRPSMLMKAEYFFQTRVWWAIPGMKLSVLWCYIFMGWLLVGTLVDRISNACGTGRQ
jgi:hypothetical protein